MSYTEAGIRKLIEGTLTDTQLKDLCHDEFPSVYRDFDGKFRSDKIRDLAVHVFKHSKVDNLLHQIKAINLDGYNRIINPVKFKDFQLYNLDLMPSIRDCLKKINRKRGLICMSFSCSNKDFVTSFCEGLEKELSRETKVFRDAARIVIPESNKITSVAREIGKRSKKLTDNNIGIFPVNIDGCNQPEQIPIFLNSIQESFQNRANFCSIIMMFKKDRLSYPSNVICNHPKVQEYELCTWINILMNKDNGKWKEAGESWQNMAIKTLSLEKNEALDIFRLYEHLAHVLDWLTDDDNYPIDPQNFLKEVEDHLNLLAQEEEYYHG